MRRALGLAALALLAVAVVRELRQPPEGRTWHGEVAGLMPYDLRPPTLARWNPADERILTPHVLGVGWSLNLAQISRRLLG